MRAAHLLAEFLKAVAQQQPDLLAGSFERPASIIEVRIHAQTSCRSTEASGLTEYFIRGTEPQPCVAHP